MSLAHLVSKQGYKFSVLGFLAVLIHQVGSSEDREGQQFFPTLQAEPFHEERLQVRQAFIVGFSAIGEIELIKEIFKIVPVKDRDIPEDTLIATSSSRLIEGVDNTLHLLLHITTIGNQVVLSVCLFCKVVEVHQELYSCSRSCKTTCNLIQEVDQGTTERVQVLRSVGGATNTLTTFKQEGVKSDGATIRFKRGLIMDINQMVVDVLQILVSNFLTEHFGQAVNNDSTINLDGFIFVQFSFHSRDILASNIGVRVY